MGKNEPNYGYWVALTHNETTFQTITKKLMSNHVVINTMSPIKVAWVI
jgi:hypothetical protein